MELSAGDTVDAQITRDAAARRLLEDIEKGREPDPRALTLVVLELRREIRRLFPELDVEDVVQTTMTRLLGRAKGRDAEVENAWGYVFAAARNSGIDAIRAQKRRPAAAPFEDAPTPDDNIAALIDRTATHAMVLAAMRAGIASGDVITIRIITKWLDIADELGRAPSTREVASRVGASHTTVAKALARFRALVELNR